MPSVEIAVTRPNPASVRTVAFLNAAGRQAEGFALTRVADLPGPLPTDGLAAPASALVFSSANAVESLVRRARAGDAVAGLLFDGARAKLSVCAVGSATAEAIRSAMGRWPELVCDGSGQQGLADAILAWDGAPKDALLIHPCAREASPALGEALAAAGRRLVSLPIYASEPDAAEASRLAVWVDAKLKRGAAVWVAFYAPSQVAAAAAALRHRHGIRFAAIGKATSEAVIRHFGAPPSAVAAEPSDTALLAAIQEAEHSLEASPTSERSLTDQ